jgi:hypothetical protein
MMLEIIISFVLGAAGGVFVIALVTAGKERLIMINKPVSICGSNLCKHNKNGYCIGSPALRPKYNNKEEWLVCVHYELEGE